ncbi:MAG: undecaprenyl-diphosphatase UppP [Candidatus Magasanikbacteria bacterium RIFOXYA2_FULL_44_8]|uniref:Undecaprenyl-diphosphatase n=1 Tax=Candidatus Magasanikbacteria bacterium RIFOXYA2_FULL_44_8 TaxID=1798696 RepID=A0A1F6NKE5_9BACT|nr:MAG: undecaprenyl-diphosphatase UppP [Candidatus Magasanikbacteria bacterium RIFOXYA2_FULL_44_8]
MSILHAIILGIIEGLTEFLPISSTGHMILASSVLKIPTTEFLKTFEISIQLGAILAVVVLYGKTVLVNWVIMKKILAAFIPTAIVGAIFYKIIKQYLLSSEPVVLWALLIGGVALIVFELLHHEKEAAVGEVQAISYRQAVAIGLFQSLAVVPGVSRAAATIVGGLVVGLKRRTIVEFSFMLAVPTMLAATALDLLKSKSVIVAADWLPLVIGFVVAFVVALAVIKWLIGFVKNHSFVGFGVYRIIIALLFWWLVI